MQLKKELSDRKKPFFCPDATRGVLRGLDSQDLLATGTKTLIVNTLHLAEKPGEDYLRKIGGVKKLMNWPGQIISDSGGFQLFSMFHRKPGLGKIVDEGLKIYTGPKRQRFNIFTPEKSIATQFALGSDMMVCLDDFTPPQPDNERLEKSVWRTIDWAKRSRAEFEKRWAEKVKEAKKSGAEIELEKPQLLAVLQGHPSQKWRRYCAEELIKIGFDGFGLGGWLINPDDGKLDLEAVAFNTTLMPESSWRYAMGVGKAEDIATLFALGYTIFDCVIPTRDARHGRISVFRREKITELMGFLAGRVAGAENLEAVKKADVLREAFDYIYIDKGQWATDERPLDEKCQCHTCQHYSRAYLHHLYQIKDVSFSRLATIHNLYFYQELMRLLGESQE